MWAWKLAWLSLAPPPVGRAAAQTGDDGLDPSLRALAAELQAALAPVTPRASFRKDLRRDLAAVARQRRSPRIVLQRPPDYRRGLLIGAAAVSSAVSVAGLVAFFWRQRSQRASLAASESYASA